MSRQERIKVCLAGGLLERKNFFYTYLASDASRKRFGERKRARIFAKEAGYLDADEANIVFEGVAGGKAAHFIERLFKQLFSRLIGEALNGADQEGRIVEFALGIFDFVDAVGE